MNFFLYGLQRSGTNFLWQLTKKNFKNIHLLNGTDRKSPSHKHFRLYDNKELVPESKYKNDFIFNSFTEFEYLLGKEAGDNAKFLVISKNPFSWYLSITRMAKEIGWESFDEEKDFQLQYILDYNAFYNKWVSFKKEFPDRIKMVKYEDLLINTNQEMENIRKFFSLTRRKNLWYLFKGGEGEYFIPGRVPNSKKWDSAKLRFYVNREYMSKLKPLENEGIVESLDKNLVQELGYDFDLKNASLVVEGNLL